jgi:tetratricopeptide (TPR) repeat protein
VLPAYARILGELGRLEERVDTYGEVLVVGAEELTALKGRIWALAALGRFEEVLADLDRALQIAPRPSYRPIQSGLCS